MKKMSVVRRILRLRKFVIAALAAATVAVGSLASIPTASALPRCEVNWAIADAYYAMGDFCWSHGLYTQGLDYFEKALALDSAPCAF